MPTIHFNIDQTTGIVAASAALATTCFASYKAGSSSVSTPTVKARRGLQERRKKTEKSLLDSSPDDAEKNNLSLGELDIRRKSQIAIGGPTDHSGGELTTENSKKARRSHFKE